MRRAPPRLKPVYATVADAMAGQHYATHVDQPIRRVPMSIVSDERMDELAHCADPATCRGVPTHFNYAEGVLRVWPWPAEGWQVWSEVSGKDVTP